LFTLVEKKMKTKYLHGSMVFTNYDYYTFWK
jgi:hypothetical protein